MWSHQLYLPTGLEAFHGLGVDVEGNAVADRANHAGEIVTSVWNRKPRLMVMRLIFPET